jgi:hypothetical protein
MKNAKFYFKLTSQGSLANVSFSPEKEELSIVLKFDGPRKNWENKEFELLVENPFEYILKVFGVTGTSWKAELKFLEDGVKKDFLEWDGVTGDTRRNFSERTTPIKNIP